MAMTIAYTYNRGQRHASRFLENSHEAALFNILEFWPIQGQKAMALYTVVCYPKYLLKQNNTPSKARNLGLNDAN